MEHNRVLALGFFDGIHLGHAALLNKTCERAKELGVTAAAMSFDTHPDTLVFGTPAGKAEDAALTTSVPVPSPLSETSNGFSAAAAAVFP